MNCDYDYEDRGVSTREIKRFIDDRVGGLHPVDRVEVAKEISEYSKSLAETQERTNDRQGVPER